MQDTEFHVFHRKIFLCEMPRDWSSLVCWTLDTAVVFIHPISDWSFGTGGYEILLLVRMSLRLGNLL